MGKIISLEHSPCFCHSQPIGSVGCGCLPRGGESFVRTALLPSKSCSSHTTPAASSVLRWLLAGRVNFTLKRFWNEANYTLIKSPPRTFWSRLNVISFLTSYPKLHLATLPTVVPKRFSSNRETRVMKGSDRSLRQRLWGGWREQGLWEAVEGRQLLRERSCCFGLGASELHLSQEWRYKWRLSLSLNLFLFPFLFFSPSFSPATL